MIVFIIAAEAAAINGRENYHCSRDSLHTASSSSSSEFVEVKFLRLVTVSETNFNIDLAAR